ncbi:hypothetical protein FHS83_001003 [Rhizomicrobium palustre]|uniref:DUF4424 domain-containing protein n=1 Tax=Rhizomicrobium palustre TaxID=189966 RepID=A0A846MWT1_9PROT|nr:DUF4424 family protein [Rhizomicrobium palustre]NIK87685.1 hypothetical protein [Rhizomicrobium palustre]
MRGVSLKAGAAVVLISGALFSAALADDSSAMLSAGSIVFTKNTPVKMAAEDLYVSSRKVRIRFEFLNPTRRDVETLVAFPLPDIDTNAYYGSAVGTLTDDPQNFIGFTAVVDGKKVPFNIEQRAFFKGKDVTERLKAQGAPVNPVAGDGYIALDKLPLAKLKMLEAAGLVEVFEAETRENGKLVKKADVVPHWMVKTRLYWPQKFPAGKTVVIEHEYQPVTGSSFFSTAYMKRHDKYSDQDYCFDAPSWAALEEKTGKAKAANPDMGGYMLANETSYILSTAGNWQGPIGRFHLTLDKGKPENILSLCWDGALKKTGPTSFEFSAENFVPKRDIHLIVLEDIAPGK